MTKDAMDASGWTTIASQAAPSSYLDPLMGRQKAKVHQRFIRAGARDLKPQAVLKADVFEEAVGSDHILFDLWPAERLTVGMDIALEAASNPEALHQAPVLVGMRRLDETQAARKPVLRWTRPA